MEKKKKVVMDGDAPYLPRGIITNIVKRLPVKSLVRFQCVCKDWKNLFKTPSFIAEHFRHHSTLQNDFLLFMSRGDRWDPGHLRLINRDMQVLEHHTPSLVQCSTIVGSSNGLLCLSSESLILCNPATREVLRVPQAPNVVDNGIYHKGFGFSPIVNDYKIVVHCLDNVNNHITHTIAVFSLRARSWKEVEAGELKGVKPNSVCGFTFNGAIFWFGFCFKSSGEEQKDWLISFDIATESFTLIPIPIPFDGSNVNRLTTHENKLAMLSGGLVEMDTPKSYCIDLWVMEKCKDKSGERWIWTKIFTIKPYPYCPYILIPQTIWRNQVIGEFEGAVDTNERQLVLCNLHLHSNEFKMLAMGEYPVGTRIWNYAESLVSLQ